MDNIYKLYKAVDSLVENPYNSYEIYAVIESLGYSDRRVLDEFGLNNIFEVGDIIFEKIKHDKKQQYLTNNMSYLLNHLIKGFIRVLPLVLLTLSLTWWYKSAVTEPIIGVKLDYEIGTSWGITTILIPIILIEGLVNIYINRQISSKKRYDIRNNADFINYSLNSLCVVNILVMIFNTIISCITMNILITVLLKYNIILGPYFTSKSYIVFTLASCGYMLIATGLFNSIILINLYQHKSLIKLLSISFITNALLSYILSRIFGYYFAILGFLISCIVFYFLSYFYCIKVFKDYNFYEGQE